MLVYIDVVSLNVGVYWCCLSKCWCILMLSLYSQLSVSYRVWMVESVGLRTSATVHRAIGVSDVKQVCVSLEQLSPRASICISVRSSKLLPIVYSACGLRTLEQSYRKVLNCYLDKFM